MLQSADCGCIHQGIPAHNSCGTGHFQPDTFPPGNRPNIFRFPANSSNLPGNCQEFEFCCPASIVRGFANYGDTHLGNLAGARAHSHPGSRGRMVAGKGRDNRDSAGNLQDIPAGSSHHKPYSPQGSAAPYRSCRRSCSRTWSAIHRSGELKGFAALGKGMVTKKRKGWQNRRSRKNDRMWIASRLSHWSWHSIPEYFHPERCTASASWPACCGRDYV